MERGRVLKRHGLFFYSPSQTGKASGLKYLCRTDRVDYSLGFIKGSASKARLCGFELDLALEGKVLPNGDGLVAFLQGRALVVWLCGVLLKKHIDIEAYLGTLAMTRERRINMIKTIQPPCRLGTTSHPSATLTPSPFGARLTPLNLASLEELHLLSRLRRQLPRGEAFRLACFPIRHTWRLYDFYIRAFRFQGVPWPFSSAAAICTIKNHVER